MKHFGNILTEKQAAITECSANDLSNWRRKLLNFQQNKQTFFFAEISVVLSTILLKFQYDKIKSFFMRQRTVLTKEHFQITFSNGFMDTGNPLHLEPFKK